MNKYKVGDKVVMKIISADQDEIKTYSVSGVNDNWRWCLPQNLLERYIEPLSAYTEPLEAKIRRQAAEITRLRAENKELKEDFEKSKRVNLNMGRLAGQNEAWELARKITCQPINGGFNRSEFEKIFGYGYISDIFEKYKYTEAATKVAEWEKTKAKILVKAGDVLENIYDSNVKCIVTNLYPNNRAYLVFDDGTAGMNELNNFKKTGRHIDIDSFLKQIGGNGNER